MTLPLQIEADFPVVYRRYTSFVDGRAVVVEGVPYLHDTDSDEFFLEPSVAEKLHQIVRNPTLKSSISHAHIYKWAETELRVADLTMRFIGPGYEYGYTPVSLFAKAADRVRETALSIRSELIKDLSSGRRQTRKFGNPYNSEPQVRYVGPGSLIVALDAPETSLFPEDVKEEVLARESMELLVDAAAWVASPEEIAMPEKLKDPKIRAVALKAVERLLPSSKEKEAAVELGGEMVEGKYSSSFPQSIMLYNELKPKIQDKFLSAIAEFQEGEAQTLTGIIHSLSRKGKISLTDMSWEVRTIEGKVSMDDQGLIDRVSQYWARGVLVEVQGVVVRRPDGSPKRIDIHYINEAPDKPAINE